MSLKTEFDFFRDKQAELVKDYNGLYLCIVGEKVEGAFPTEVEAYQYGKDEFGIGKFLVQACIPGEDGYSETFHSRVGI